MAPTKSIIGGNFQDALGNLVTGNLLLVLSQDAQIPGGGPLVPTHIRIPVNGGAVASTPIWFNDQMQPGNLAYTATVYDSTGNKVYGPELWSLTGASPFNLSTIVPLLISPDPLFANPVLQNPASAQTITGFGLTFTSSAPLTLQGALIASGVASFTSTLVAATIGPTVGQQHSLPTVANDTIALLAAAQTFTNKTLTSPVISVIVNTGTLTLPTSTDVLVGRATTDTLTNKTLTNPALSNPSSQHYLGSGTGPTCSVTGAGTGATCDTTTFSGSKDFSGILTIHSGTTPAANGAFTLTFNGSYPTNGFCSFTLKSSSGAWNARATVIATNVGPSTNQGNWDNNAVSLTASVNYDIIYVCAGS